MNSKLNILLVENDSSTARLLTTSLTLNEYHVIKVKSGKEALSIATSHCPDLILLDLELPDTSGIDVLKELRLWLDVPIVVISEKSQERDKVMAFDMGADDYITKPLGISELMARIRVLIKRTLKLNFQDKESNMQIINKGLFIDFEKRIVKVDEKEIKLTPIEYKILTILARNPGKVLTYDFIMREVWGPYACEKHTLRVNIANIRNKIESNLEEPKYILTVIGVGYRMTE